MEARPSALRLDSTQAHRSQARRENTGRRWKSGRPCTILATRNLNSSWHGPTPTRASFSSQFGLRASHRFDFQAFKVAKAIQCLMRQLAANRLPFLYKSSPYRLQHWTSSAGDEGRVIPEQRCN